MARKSLKSMFSRKKKVGMSDEDRFRQIAEQQILEEAKRKKKTRKRKKRKRKATKGKGKKDEKP